MRRSGRRLSGAVVAGACALAAIAPSRVTGQAAASLLGTVVDARAGTPVADAAVSLRPLGIGGPGGQLVRTTAADGMYSFHDLARGRYSLTVERIGYRPFTIGISLDRSEPVVLSVQMEPVPFPLAELIPGGVSNGPILHASPIDAGRASRRGLRAAAIRGRQSRFLSTDARQLGSAELRELNTFAEYDILRAFQRVPGVSVRDDYAAELWTRGAPADHTTILFDGVPLIGGLHALGVMGGLNSDVLGRATFQPGVVSASEAGAGAGVIAVESRPPGQTGTGTAGLSPLSARAAADGRLSERVGWSVGVRRSWLDALSNLTGGAVPQGGLPYAFADATGRVDVSSGDGSRVEASFFWQRDRVFGDVPDIAYGNDGHWGSTAARLSFIAPVGDAMVHSTVGTSSFDASLRVSRAAEPTHAPLHPPTENHYRTFLVDTRIATSSGWAAGMRVSHERHSYNGPGVDLARLLAPDELERRGIPELTPIILEIERSRLLLTSSMTRIAFWGERRGRITSDIEAAAGFRLETGDRVAGGNVRVAPRLRARWRRAGSPFAVSAAYGRSWQYVQSVANTDVLRTGLRASEVLVQADDRTPALRSDMATVGAEAWAGSTWLFGLTGWLRETDGILLPDPRPGVIDEPRQAVPASGRARGVEVSVRKLDGRVRGFANYTRSWSRQRAGAREFDASEDRSHVANIGIVGDVLPAFMVGVTVRAHSGSPYTRITLIDSGCESSLDCRSQPVLIGTPGGQRTPAWGSLDLMAEWTHRSDGWSLSLYGQVRNATARANAATYHSSCLCVNGRAASDASLRDRFDRGLPRLPILGLRVRF